MGNSSAVRVNRAMSCTEAASTLSRAEQSARRRRCMELSLHQLPLGMTQHQPETEEDITYIQRDMIQREDSPSSTSLSIAMVSRESLKESKVSGSQAELSTLSLHLSLPKAQDGVVSEHKTVKKPAYKETVTIPFKESQLPARCLPVVDN